jgi:ferredoxin
MFDSLYEKGLVTEDICDIIVNRFWWGEATKFGAIDIAAYAHHFMAPAAQMWLDKTRVYMAAQKVRINEGIERMKSFLKINPQTMQPWLVIDKKCVGILSEFGAAPNPFDGQDRTYTWKIDREGQVVGTVPEDRYNDAIKAMTYGLVDRFGYVTTVDRRVVNVGKFE